jgi:hypothetical protein
MDDMHRQSLARIMPQPMLSAPSPQPWSRSWRVGGPTFIVRAGRGKGSVQLDSVVTSARVEAIYLGQGVCVGVVHLEIVEDRQPQDEVLSVREGAVVV